MFNTTCPPTRPIQMPSSPAVPVTSRPVRLTRRAEALSVAAGVLMAVASALGLLVGGLYRDPESTASMLRGYDFVTLLVAVPLLAAALWGVQRGSVRAQLVWIGVLAYAVYNYALYVFGSAFNAAFLLDVAVFSATLAALTLALSGLDATGVAQRFSRRTPARWIAGVLALLALGLGGMWIANAIGFTVTGNLPAGSALVETPAVVHLGIALDLSVLVPAYALAAGLLWRRMAWGYPLAAMVLVAGTIHQLGYLVALPFQVRAGVPGATPIDPGEPPIALAFLVAALVLLACAGNVPGRVRLSPHRRAKTS